MDAFSNLIVYVMYKVCIFLLLCGVTEITKMPKLLHLSVFMKPGPQLFFTPSLSSALVQYTSILFFRNLYTNA